MIFKKHSGLIIIPMILFLGACDNGSIPQQTYDPVYIIGSYISGESPKAYFWRGGDTAITQIPVAEEMQQSTARAIAVSGADIYIAGDYHLGNTYWNENQEADRQDQESPYRTYYWKYGDPSVTRIVPPGETENVYTGSVYTSGLTILNEGVYIAGYYKEGQTYKTYYIQPGGEMNALDTLPLLPPKTHDLRMTRSGDGSFYLTGYVIEGEQAEVFYWKTGDADLNRLPITGPGGDFHVSDMKVSGADIYITGYYREKPSLYKAYYWKGGGSEPVFLPAPTGAEQFKTEALDISGDTVYIVGNYVVQGLSQAYFWKSGDSKISGLPLPQGTGNMYASALAVSGNELYIGGDYVQGSRRTAYYWKYGDTRVSLLPRPQDEEVETGDFVIEAIALPGLYP
jgi:hypothetical protein